MQTPHTKDIADAPRRRKPIKILEARQRLHELLGALGMGVIDVPQFWRYMADAGLTDQDIDRYCEEEGGWCPDPEAAS